MEHKKFQRTSIAALIVSVLPLATFIPVSMKMTLTDNVRSIWTGVNFLFILVGLCLSIVCVKNSESRSIANIVSTVLSIFWVLLVAGIVVLALFLNFVQ